MTNPEHVRDEAARVFRQRNLDAITARITDPVWRARAQQFAAGRMSAQDILAYADQSPTVLRNLDRHLMRLTELSDDELTALRAQRDRHIDQIAEELTAERQPQSRLAPARPRRVQVTDDQEGSWEDGSWMERA